MLAEASAPLSGGQGRDGMKTLSTHKIAAAHTKAYSKINSDDKVAVLTARDAMKEGTQDMDLHARDTTCLDELTKSVEKCNGLTSSRNSLATTRRRSWPCPFS